MEWKNNMNLALEYIEDHLTEKIDCSELAKMMSCSEWEFRRIFSVFAQISLSEYIRNRRLTLAAADIQNGEKIIDVALKYGYESHASFSRAFRKFHGVSPSMARNSDVRLNCLRPMTFKLIIMEENEMGKCVGQRVNIIGAGQVSYAVSVDLEQEKMQKENQAFWNTIGNDVIGCTALPFYGAFVSEEKCHLLGDMTGKRVLEIGCGTGHSLKYMGDKGASELWGIDISGEQLEKAKEVLQSCGYSSHLICMPMEEEGDIPKEYFDCIYSIYGVGWTTDLLGTFKKIASYMKKDGIFVFSWSHPMHKCIAYEHDALVMKRSYFDEAWYKVPFDGAAIELSDRMLSTYVNVLSEAGFVIEKMVEESDADILQEWGENDFAKKAEMIPATLVIKARLNKKSFS